MSEEDDLADCVTACLNKEVSYRQDKDGVIFCALLSDSKYLCLCPYVGRTQRVLVIGQNGWGTHANFYYACLKKTKK